jgi:hypothetical protein
LLHLGQKNISFYPLIGVTVIYMIVGLMKHLMIQTSFLGYLLYNYEVVWVRTGTSNQR